MTVEEQAVDILTKAILFVKENGFDISTYRGRGTSTLAPRCYIGTLLTVANLIETDDVYETMVRLKPTDAVYCAFSVAEEIARPMLDAATISRKADRPVGYLLEAYGFKTQRDATRAQMLARNMTHDEIIQAHTEIDKAQCDEAIRMFEEARDVLLQRIEAMNAEFEVEVQPELELV